MPYFTTAVYTNLTSGIIKSFDARFDRTFDITVNEDGNILYTFVTDNEIQSLEGTATIPEPIDPEDPENPVDPINPENNQTSNDPTTTSASAAMKSTGLPINMILLVFLSILGVLVGRKQ